jgi:hypothetical protein
MPSSFFGFFQKKALKALNGVIISHLIVQNEAF